MSIAALLFEIVFTPLVLLVILIIGLLVIMCDLVEQIFNAEGWFVRGDRDDD